MGLYRIQFDDTVLDTDMEDERIYWIKKSIKHSIAEKVAELPYDVERIKQTPLQVDLGVPIRERVTCDFAILDQKEVTNVMIAFRALISSKVVFVDSAEERFIHGIAQIIFGDDYKAILKL